MSFAAAGQVFLGQNAVQNKTERPSDEHGDADRERELLRIHSWSPARRPNRIARISPSAAQLVANVGALNLSAHSNAKMRFQSSFMLTTIQPCFFAMSYISWLKVPTDVLGNPCAGP